MARSNILAALVAIGTALAFSGAAEAKKKSHHGPERGLDSLNQPVVQRTDYVLEIRGHDDGLSATERARLNSWFESLGLGYGDRVYVEEGYGPGPVRHAVARVAADYGILLSDGAPVMAGEAPPGGARVIVSRSTAHVPNCPNWRPLGPTSTSSNYGCGVNSNLAAMMADPNDLVLGQSGSVTGDGTQASKAIKVYRETAPTGTRGLTKIQTGGQ